MRVKAKATTIRDGGGNLIIALGERWIGTSPCLGISKAFFDCLVPLGTGPKLPVKDVRLKEKLQSLLRIEPGARRLNLKNGTQGRHVNAKLVGSGQQLGTR